MTDLIFEVLPFEQLLLERAATKGSSHLAQRMVEAGRAENGNALDEAVECEHGAIVNSLKYPNHK